MDMGIGFPNLGIHLDHVGKTISVFGFDIAFYGIIIAVGMLIGIWFVIMEAKRTNQNQDFYLDMLILSILAAVIGARLYYVAFSWSNYKNDLLQIFNIRSGGLAIYGGIIGGVLAAAVFCKVKKVSFWQMADTSCPGILIGQIIGRWGNFFNREAFGDYTNGPFAMQLPVSAVRPGEITAAMQEHITSLGGVDYIQVHPTFLYESLWNLALLLFLLWYRRKKKFQGELFYMYLAGYGLGRMWIESLRTDQLLIPGTQIPVSLVLSAVLAAGCVIVILVKRSVTKKRAELAKRREEVDSTNDEEEDDTGKKWQDEETSGEAVDAGKAAGGDWPEEK
ncbi:MAG: prolipoprotein diacylglyceryl transferase [Blautia sp.]|jgi:phosphatidylglycerol:prolipoprotein diacylglycerol transferase